MGYTYIGESWFFDICVKEKIGDRVYEGWEKELYSESPLFEIEAVNG